MSGALLIMGRKKKKSNNKMVVVQSVLLNPNGSIKAINCGEPDATIRDHSATVKQHYSSL